MERKIDIEMIKLKTEKDVEEYWAHWKNYSENDIRPNIDIGPPWNDEMRKHFYSEDFKPNIMKIFKRKIDPLCFVKFVKNGSTVGFCEYITYLSEDGKCVICEYFILDEYRNSGNGQKCFEMLKNDVLKNGATYFSLYCTNTKALRFWKKQGFTEYKRDENHPSKDMIYTYLMPKED